MEIERKWLLSMVPDCNEYYKYDTNQLYLSAETPEVRIRSKLSLISPLEPESAEPRIPNYKLTIKSAGTLSREEVEFSLTQDEYNRLKSTVEGRPIHKTYYVFPLGHDLELEVSLVDQSWIYGEVEFKSEEQANSFIFPFPECNPIEVTSDSFYKMKNYWKRTRLNERMEHE